MNIQVTLGASPEFQKSFSDLSAAITALANLNTNQDGGAAERVASVKAAVEKNQVASIAKPAKKTKAAAAAAVEEDSFDLGKIGAAEPEEEEVIEYTQADVMTAFKNYLAASGKEGRAAAEKILKKYKVVSVKDIKEENFADVIDALKALEE